jgi:hypothetical protein
MASAQNEEQLRAWERARALGNLGVLSNDDDHRHARSNARAVNPDDARVVDARHHSPPPQPRRTHGTPGSYSSPETTHNSQQLIEDLSEVISSPTRADRPVRGEPSSHQVNRQILAGIEDSFEDIDPPEEHSSLGRQHKRNSDMLTVMDLGYCNNHMNQRQTLISWPTFGEPYAPVTTPCMMTCRGHLLITTNTTLITSTNVNMLESQSIRHKTNINMLGSQWKTRHL